MFSVNVFFAKMLRLAEKRTSPRPPRERLLSKRALWRRQITKSRKGENAKKGTLDEFAVMIEEQDYAPSRLFESGLRFPRHAFDLIVDKDWEELQRVLQ